MTPTPHPEDMPDPVELEADFTSTGPLRTVALGYTAEHMRLYAEQRTRAMRDLAERLKQEAQIHAQEARTANTTIAEIYQVVTGKTGEPGNWHGAEPVRKCIGELRETLTNCIAALEAAESEMRDWHCEHPARVQISNAIDNAQLTLSTPPSAPGKGEAEGHVGESHFEAWFAEKDMKGLGTKQIARDAYAAGMGERPNATPHHPASAEAGKGVVCTVRINAHRLFLEDWNQAVLNTLPDGDIDLYAHPSESVTVSGEVSKLPVYYYWTPKPETGWPMTLATWSQNAGPHKDWDVVAYVTRDSAILALAGSGGKA